jgi:hypothetical protein
MSKHQVVHIKYIQFFANYTSIKLKKTRKNLRTRKQRNISHYNGKLAIPVPWHFYSCLCSWYKIQSSKGLVEFSWGTTLQNPASTKSTDYFNISPKEPTAIYQSSYLCGKNSNQIFLYPISNSPWKIWSSIKHWHMSEHNCPMAL